MKGFVYILKDEKGKFYIGSTVDIRRRLKQHNSAHTKTTHRMQNPKLVLIQEYNSLEIARKIERGIKNLKRKDYIEKMINDGYIRIIQ
ncbi:MAG: GIY-YIG nuclease family protein [bacterium]|nr:GIY-YIG nuclease family protein [bacterium]